VARPPPFDPAAVKKELKFQEVRLGEPAEVILGSMNRRWKPALRLSRRLLAEITMDLVLQAKSLYGSFHRSQDKSYATVGLYRFNYRRPLLPKHESQWVRQLAVVVDVCKTGVRAPTLRQLYTGGWVGLEYNLLPYALRGGRLLVRVSPVGGHREQARHHLTARKRSALRIEAVAGVEAQWIGERARMRFTSSMFPRYSFHRPAVRFLSELAFSIQIHELPPGAAWISKINLVPKVVHSYNSDPLILQLQGEHHAALMRSDHLFHISNLRNVITLYLNVMFVMSR
jgi:hypothetical protein